MSELLFLDAPNISADMSEAGFAHLPPKFIPDYVAESQSNGGILRGIGGGEGSQAKGEGLLSVVCVLIYRKIKWMQLLLNKSGHILQREDVPK